jgi:hypothetical protein
MGNFGTIPSKCAAADPIYWPELRGEWGGPIVEWPHVPKMGLARIGFPSLADSVDPGNGMMAVIPVFQISDNCRCQGDTTVVRISGTSGP